MQPLWNDEFENHFSASVKGKGAILASYGPYGQYEGRPLKRRLYGAIPTIKLERIESLENHGLETHFNAKMECKDANE